MEIVLLTIGKTSTKYIQVGIDEYLKRLKHYIPFSIVSLPDIRSKGKQTEESQKNSEGERILSVLKPGDKLILLDERGIEFTSLKYAEQLQREMSSGLKRLVYAVGGPYGFSKAVYSRADAKLSMSKMTLSHEMIRLFFVEQVYRAMTILRGEPYHHE